MTLCNLISHFEHGAYHENLRERDVMTVIVGEAIYIDFDLNVSFLNLYFSLHL
ncbi:hypothetical protein LguiB_006182 [Lonicera macranthoides]